MDIKAIGKYWSVTAHDFKQIYSPHNRMLQITHTPTGDKLSYVDTHAMRTIKNYIRKIFWRQNELR